MKKIFAGLLLVLFLGGCSMNNQNSNKNSIDKIHFTITNGSIHDFDGTDVTSSDKETIEKVQDMLNELELNDKNKIEASDDVVGANTSTLELIENEKTITTYTFYGNSITVNSDSDETIYHVDDMNNIENLIDFLEKI